MAALWGTFAPYLMTIANQTDDAAYGVIVNDGQPGFEYICAVAVSSFPATPAHFVRLTMPPQTYAVFEHRENISSLMATMQALEPALRAAGHEQVRGPWLERYTEAFDPATGNGGLEIWVPIRT
jgi:AraC family transcriptional regulator